jgi:hypothetical protein
LVSNLLARHTPLPATTASLSHRRRGNLGEFIAFWVGRDHAYTPPAYHVVAANAFDPLQDISVSNIDIIWFRIGTSPEEDCVVLHEMKLTTDPSLAYADNLVADYKKLFGPSVGVSIHARLQVLSNYVEFTLNRPDVLPRIAALAGDAATRSTRVVLTPTLVHDLAHGDPVTRLVSVRTQIETLGWNASQITPWSIALSDLESRLLRIARGEA